MKKTLVTVLDNQFIDGFLVLVYSLRKHNSEVNYDFHVIDVGLTDKNKTDCKSIYENVYFITPEQDSYKDFRWEASKEKIQKSFYKLEMFRLEEYDQAIAIDSDMLVLGDIDELLENNYTQKDIYGVPGYHRGRDRLRDHINGGLIIVNKPLLNRETYDALTKHSQKGFLMVEQDALNDYFGKQIGHLPKEFNVEKRMLHSKKFRYKFDGTDAKIIHFISSKPWDSPSSKKGREKTYTQLENLWWEYYEKAKNRYPSISIC